MTNPNSPASGPSSAPSTDITKEALIAAAQRDDASAKELLRGSDERAGQADRVRLALSVLQSDMKESKKEEKVRIARAARELMDEHLDAVRKELKTTTDANLEDLEKKMSNARTVAIEEERAATDVLSYESIQLEANEVVRDIKAGDWKTWLKYAGAAAAAGLTAKWVWDHTVGKLWNMAMGDKKPGIFRRMASWTVGLGAAALGALGLSRYGRFSNELLDFGKKAVERGGKGAKEGLETGAGNTYKKVTEAFGLPNVTKVQKDLEDGKYNENDLSYKFAYFTAMAQDGIGVVWEGSGAGHFTRSGVNLVIQDIEFFSSLTQFVMSGGGNAEAGWNAYEVWVNGTVLYATSFGALSTAISVVRTPTAALKPLELLKTLTFESAVWPVTVAGKVKDSVLLVATENGRVTLREIAGSPGFQWNRMMENWMPFRSQTTARMQGLVDEWKGWKELERSMRGGGDEVLIKSLQEKCNAIEKNILASAQSLRGQRGAGKALDLTSDLRHIIDHADNLDTVTHALNQLAEVNGHKLAGLADKWIDLQRALREATTALEKGRITERIEQVVADMHDTAKALKVRIDAGQAVDGLTPSLKTLVEEGTDKIKLTRYLESGATTVADAAEATTDAAKAVKAGAGAADETLKAAEEGAEVLADAGKGGKTATAGVKTAAEAYEDPFTLAGLSKKLNAAPPAGGTEASVGTTEAVPPSKPPVAAATQTVAETVETGDEWVRAAAQARKALLAPNATDEAAMAIDNAINTCKALGMKSTQAIEAVKDPLAFLALKRTPRQYSTALAVATESGDVTQNLRRIGAFLSGFDKLDDAAIAAKVFNLKLLRTLADSGLKVESIADFLKTPALRKALNSADELDDVLKSFIWWEHTKSIGGVINVAGAAISVLMLGMDIASYVEMRARLSKTIEKLDENLRKAGFEKKGDSFVHPKTKKKISMSLLSENVNNLSTEQGYRIGAGFATSATSIATVIAPSLALGPAGLAILGIHLTIEAGLTVANDQRNREFLRDTPASVLALIGMGQTIGKSEKDVLDESSSWLWSDLINSRETNERDKALFRKKAVAIMFFQELGSLMKESPEVPMRILADKFSKGGSQMDAGSFLDEENGAFWVEDYEKIIKPFLAARLFQMSTDSSVKWSEFRDLKIDEGIFDLENIAPADFQLALREAAHLYAQHLKERDYLDQKKKTETNKSVPLDEKVVGVQSFDVRAQRTLQVEGGERDLKAYADQTAFGKKVSELDDGSGVTSAERYLRDVTKRLDSRARETAAESKTQRDAINGIIGSGPIPVRTVEIIRGDERNLMGAKEIFTGKNPGEEGNLRLEDAAGISGREAERPLAEADVLAVLAKGREVFEDLEPVGYWQGGLVNNKPGKNEATLPHFQQLKEFSYLVQRQPTIAKEPATQAFLAKVKTLTEGFSWDVAYRGSDFAAKRDEAFRQAVQALGAMNRSLDARTYHLAKPERGSVYTHVLCLPNQTAKIFTDFDMDAAPTMRGDPSVLYVERDGETIEIKPPTAGQNYSREIPGCGKFTCEMQGYSLKGKPAYRHRWTFERAPDAKKEGAELYAYFKSDGAEQPGTNISLPTMRYFRQAVQADFALVTEDPSTLAHEADVTIVYRPKDGETVRFTGTLNDILKKHPVGIRGLNNTDPKTKERATWTKFVPKDGATLIGCRVEFRTKPKTVDYVWKPQEPAPLATAKPAPAKKKAA